VICARRAGREDTDPGVGSRYAGIASIAAGMSAWANAAAVRKRSAGTLASALAIARSYDSGTASRMPRNRGALSFNRRARIACAVEPWNGGTPASASYSRHPNE
jgi:hypothetical protein